MLKKKINTWNGVSIAIGMVLGSGLLGLPGMAIETSSPVQALYAWLIIILLMIPMIKMFITLGLKYSESAGLAKYAEIAAGKWANYGVTFVLCGAFVIGIPALAMIGGAYASKLLGLEGSLGMHLLAAAILIGSTVINLIGVKVTSFINTISVYMILFTVVILVGYNSNDLVVGVNELLNINSNLSKLDILALWPTLALLFWAFLGWENMSFTLEEFDNPKKTISRVYWMSFVFVSILYFSLALVATGAELNGISTTGINGLYGLIENSKYMGTPILIVMILLIVANANSWVMGASRLVYAAGADNILPRFLGLVNGKNSIPYNSLITMCIAYILIIFCVYILQIKVSSIVLLVSQNFLVLFGFSIVAYFRVVDKNSSNIIVGIMCVAVCLFMLSGFGWYSLYPFVLLLLGLHKYIAFSSGNNAIPAKIN